MNCKQFAVIRQSFLLRKAYIPFKMDQMRVKRDTAWENVFYFSSVIYLITHYCHTDRHTNCVLPLPAIYFSIQLIFFQLFCGNVLWVKCTYGEANCTVWHFSKKGLVCVRQQRRRRNFMMTTCLFISRRKTCLVWVLRTVDCPYLPSQIAQYLALDVVTFTRLHHFHCRVGLYD